MSLKMKILEFIQEYRLALLFVIFGGIGVFLGWATGEGISAFINCVPMAVLCYIAIKVIDIIKIRSGEKWI
jgi:hypothetical protein